MKKYFYLSEGEKRGPFSLEELRSQNLSRDTRVWFYGLENWTILSEIEELRTLTNAIPPPLKDKISIEIQPENKNISDIHEKQIEKKKSKTKRYYIVGIVIIVIISMSILISYRHYLAQKEMRLYKNIATSAYDGDVNFDFYVDKFYRDIGVYGLFPKKPKIEIIKFAKFDYIDDATHYHGISFGMNDDDRIEIYINPSTWEQFTKPMRYFLMYHELAHDVLNLDDLEDTPANEGKLMYPVIASYESKTMDDFIESSHALFEEVSSQESN